MTCIILAGGFGHRLRPALPDTPKPLAPIAGKAFLEYLIQYWQQQGIDHFILATGYGHTDIQQFIIKKGFGSFVDFSQEKEPLGTGGAFLQACQLLKNKSEPFLLVNGDTFFPIPLKKLLSAQSQTDADIIIPLNHRENKNQSHWTNISFDENHKLLSVQTSTDSQAWVSAGTYCLHPRALTAWEHLSYPLNFETDLLSQNCIGKNLKTQVIPVSDISFIDIGTPEDYTRAQTFIPEVIK